MYSETPKNERRIRHPLCVLLGRRGRLPLTFTAQPQAPPSSNLAGPRRKLSGVKSNGKTLLSLPCAESVLLVAAAAGRTAYVFGNNNLWNYNEIDRQYVRVRLYWAEAQQSWLGRHTFAWTGKARRLSGHDRAVKTSSSRTKETSRYYKVVRCVLGLKQGWFREHDYIRWAPMNWIQSFLISKRTLISKSDIGLIIWTS